MAERAAGAGSLKERPRCPQENRWAGERRARRAPALIDSQSEGVKENKSGGSALLVTC